MGKQTHSGDFCTQNRLCSCFWSGSQLTPQSSRRKKRKKRRKIGREREEGGGGKPPPKKYQSRGVIFLPPLCNHLMNRSTLSAGLRTCCWGRCSCKETPRHECPLTGLSLTHFAGSDCCCHCHRSSFWLLVRATRYRRRYKASLWPTLLPKGDWVGRLRCHKAKMPRQRAASRHKDSGSPCLWFAGEDLHHSTCSPRIPPPSHTTTSPSSPVSSPTRWP